MTSQTWQGIAWTHKIEIVKPAKCDYPSSAILFITGGNPRKEMSPIGLALAGLAGCPVAILYNIPNQPLFDGKREDALIAHTFVKALETGDETWPLLLPMTKAAVRAMDAVQAFSKSQMGNQITSFVVSGASKRGWTTWLTAAADNKRVKGIVPIVYDNLNLAAQMARQIACYGKYSEQIDDYTKLDIQDSLRTEKGQRLASIVDPWAYRDRITVPKLIINGTNDPYWTLDSLNLYWNDLKGPKLVQYVPNAGHGAMSDPSGALKLLATSAAFVRAIASDSPLPKLDWTCTVDKSTCRLSVRSTPKCTSASLWTTASDSLDFRGSKWSFTRMTAGKDGFSGSMPVPEKGYAACFGEVSVSAAGREFTLCTQIRIVGPGGSVPSTTSDNTSPRLPGTRYP
jgi:PhoPQ-activated pathogenicity-related protein